jgi:catalase
MTPRLTIRRAGEADLPRIVELLSHAQNRIQLRRTTVFYKADPDYGRRVATGLGLDVGDIERLAGMSPEERVKASAEGV